MSNDVWSHSLDEYNPFGQDPSSSLYSAGKYPTGSEVGRGGGGSAGVGGQYQQQQQQQQQPVRETAVNEFEKRQKQLDAREQELSQREQEASERQRLQQNPNDVKNWPPIPNCCPCKPCFRQNFELDFKIECRYYIQWAYYLWLAYVGILFINVFGALAYLIKSINIDRGASTFGSSLFLFIVLTPLSYLAWYRPLYRAFKNDSSVSFFAFFITFGIQIAIVIIQCLGFNWFASCGWINSLAMLKEDTGVAALMLIIAGLFTTMAVFQIVFIMRVHNYYRTSGASFQKAKQEFSQGVVNDPGVRSAVYKSVSNTP